MIKTSDRHEKKGASRIGDITVLADHRVKEKEKWKKKRDKYLDFGREPKKKQTIKHEGDACNWCTWNNPQRLIKRLEDLAKKGTW